MIVPLPNYAAAITRGLLAIERQRVAHLDHMLAHEVLDPEKRAHLTTRRGLANELAWAFARKARSFTKPAPFSSFGHA